MVERKGKLLIAQGNALGCGKGVISQGQKNGVLVRLLPLAGRQPHITDSQGVALG